MRNHFLRAATDAGGGAPPVSNAWDIEFAEFTGTPQNFFVFLDIGEGVAGGLSFKSDGTSMYLVGSNQDTVYQYSLSTAWDVSTASYSSKSFSVVSQETNPNGLYFKPDGTKMYVVGGSQDTVFEYDLSTAWDVSTASYSTNAFSVATQETIPEGVFFKDDGTEMYVVGRTSDAVHQYTLSTAWDISTASFTQSFSVSSQDANPREVVFGNSGTRMYIVGDSDNAIFQYNLSTAWDISTASYSNNSISVANQDSQPSGLFFKSDGTAFYMLGYNTDSVWQYSLSTAWDISTASFTYPSNDFKSIDAQESLPTGIAFKTDGTKMYIVGWVGDDVNEYDLSTAWDISTASYVQAFSVATEDNTPNALFFKDDGTKMYIIGLQNDSIYEYNLSTAWDVSTASHNQTVSVSTYETQPTGIYIGDSGTKMYVAGTTGDDVNEFDLSTAWDISTGTFVQTFSVGGNPRGIWFKDDGTRMYISDAASNDTEQYILTTAWDISTASFDNAFNARTLATSQRGIYFKPDGTKLFVIGDSANVVVAYNIS